MAYPVGPVGSVRPVSEASGAGELRRELADLAAVHGPRYRLEFGDVAGEGTGRRPGEETARRPEVGTARRPGGRGETLPADRLLDARSPELSHLLDTEYRGSGHRTAHAAALTLIAVYAGRVTAPALLLWALTGRVLDVRPQNVEVRPKAGHGIAEVRLRVARTLPPRGGAYDGPDGVPHSEHQGAQYSDPNGRTNDNPNTHPCSEHVLQRVVLDAHLLPLARALHRHTRAGLRQLRGGVAHGCATALAASAADPGRMARRWCEFTDGAGAVGASDLARLGDVTTLTRDDGTERLVYLRRTCCLFYTSAEAVRCASCCLTSVDERLVAYARTPRPA